MPQSAKKGIIKNSRILRLFEIIPITVERMASPSACRSGELTIDSDEEERNSLMSIPRKLKVRIKKVFIRKK